MKDNLNLKQNPHHKFPTIFYIVFWNLPVFLMNKRHHILFFFSDILFIKRGVPFPDAPDSFKLSLKIKY